MRSFITRTLADMGCTCAMNTLLSETGHRPGESWKSQPSAYTAFPAFLQLVNLPNYMELGLLEKQAVAQLLLLLLLRALQSLTNLGLFYDCSSLVPILCLSSPISNFHFFNSSTEPSHLITGLPIRRVTSGLCRVYFLQIHCSCILKWYPSHLYLPTLITVTISSSLCNLKSSWLRGIIGSLNYSRILQWFMELVGSLQY
jgi:hypothetical protein